MSRTGSVILRERSYRENLVKFFLSPLWERIKVRGL
jgi:hypothetical protein